MNELIEQAFRLVLSTEMLGNPVGLFSHLSRGMHTFVNEPIDSVERGEFPPLDFVVGVTKGTGGLVSAAVSGIGATASGLARTGKWFEGMMKGVGKGAIGLVVKPITGST